MGLSVPQCWGPSLACGIACWKFWAPSRTWAMFSCTSLLLGLGWSLSPAREQDPSLLLMDAAHRLLQAGTASASPGLDRTSSPSDLGTASTLGRVGYSSKASLEVPLLTPGRAHPGRAPACSRKPSARSAAAQATKEPEPWRKCPGPMVGQGGAGTGTALMVPSCFSPPQLGGKVDFGIWSPLLYPRLLFTLALPSHLHWSRGESCSPMSSARASFPRAAGHAAPSTEHL